MEGSGSLSNCEPPPGQKNTRIRQLLILFLFYGMFCGRWLAVCATAWRKRQPRGAPGTKWCGSFEDCLCDDSPNTCPLRGHTGGVVVSLVDNDRN